MRRLWLAWLISTCTLAAQTKPDAGSIAGSVFNSVTSEPVRKAYVTLTGPQVGQLADQTDAAGKFLFSGLPPGTYRVSASHTGFIDHAARHPITLGPNQDVTDGDIRLPPQGVIGGRVLDEDGDPVPGSRVLILRQVYREGKKQWSSFDQAITNDIGEYRIAKLAPGRYIFIARAQLPRLSSEFGESAKMSYVPTYYPNASSQQAALPVEVGAAADLRDIDIHLIKRALPPVFHVSGKVAGVPADSPSIVVSLTGADEFECGNIGNSLALPPDYAFDVTTRAGQCTISASSLDAFAIYGSANLTVGGDVAGVVVAMAPPATLTGKISMAEDGSKVKLQGVSVTLNDPSFHVNVQTARSDASGRLTFSNSMRHGHYSMSVDAGTLPDGCFIRDVKIAGQESSLDDFEVQGATQMEIVLSNTAGKIKGSASDAAGNAVALFTVTLIPADGKSRSVKQSADDKGNFQFAGLRPGKYQLFAWEEVNDDLWQDPDFRVKYENLSTQVSVGPSETEAVQLRVIPAEEMK